MEVIGISKKDLNGWNPEKYSDRIYLTDDNPRNENHLKYEEILKENKKNYNQ